MSQKQRTTFALKNFRGLDKENKLLKVQSYRASDGYNFIIDSETLKTRPSFNLAHNPNFFLEAGDYLIDWHLFGQVYVYVTKNHIYLVLGNFVFNEKSFTIQGNQVDGGILIKSDFQNSFNFANLKPIFQEEKDCLFIFGLNEIFVISTFKVDTVNFTYLFLYSLRQKPNNLFIDNPGTKAFTFFENLPTPYVPTLFLGSNALDDVNLLSNQSKYQLFANVPTTILGTTTYNLPTYYNQTKHGGFSANNIKVTFYKDRYEDLPAFPVFMGVHNENWFGVITGGTAITTTNELPSYAGTILNTTPFVIENTFFPQATFEYAEDGNNEEQIIFEKYGISKKDFFDFIVKGSENQTVFEFLMSYIRTNKNDIGLTANTGWTTENKVLVFSLRTQYEAILRDNQDRDVISKSVRQKDVLVYVQLRKFDLDTTYLTPTFTSSSPSITTDISNTSYPTAPTPTQAVSPNIYVLNNNNPIQIVGSFEEEMRKLAIARIQQLTPANNTWVAVQAKLYTSKIISPPISINMPNALQENVLEVATGFYDDYIGLSYPEYPDFNNPNPPGYSVKEFSEQSVGGSLEFTFLEGTTERTQLITLITNYVNNTSQVATDNFNLSKGFGVFKMKMRRASRYRTVSYPATGFTTYEQFRTCAVVVRVSISPPILIEETRFGVTYQVQVQTTQNIAKDNRYSINLKDDSSTIELKVRDFFYDYKNEPSIEVLVTFQQNTDYNIISQSKFGATFGSENRLFLAGNSNFPNIDRFNVSNDLLGNTITNQSYELSYFPSKNYRVLGGKGAINGYVVATDNQLYITKENYPNDSKLFIRQRNISEQGRVSYVEYKTNITKSPLNNRCIIRFYNDILVLAKDGLFGIEISQNVLTDERLVKLRSGFINKDLVEAIANYDNNKIFVVENDIYMYIVIGDKLYLADSRYISQNPNSAVENLSYEIIEWKINTKYIDAKVIDDIVYFVEENNNLIYSLREFNSDELLKKGSQDLIQIPFQNNNIYTVFNLTNSDFPDVFISPSSYVIKLLNMQEFINDAYILKGTSSNDYTISGDTVTINNLASFANIENGSKVFFKTTQNSFEEFTVLNLIGTTFEVYPSIQDINSVVPGDVDVTQIYQRVNDSELYIKDIYTHNGTKFMTLTNTKPDSVNVISSTSLPSIEQSMNIRNNIVFSNNVVLRDVLVIKKTPINLRWVSAITDFGVAQMEKTSFTVNLYATKKEETNTIQFGHRTIRRMSGLSSPIDLSNNFDFNEVAYSSFALSTFNTVAISLPMKENNFLYIQFTINGIGKIEINAIEVVYKNNRMLKSIG
jgi:hypothetical protein